MQLSKVQTKIGVKVFSIYEKSIIDNRSALNFHAG
jgi:hypothetical protein